MPQEIVLGGEPFVQTWMVNYGWPSGREGHNGEQQEARLLHMTPGMRRESDAASLVMPKAAIYLSKWYLLEGHILLPGAAIWITENYVQVSVDL